MLALSAVLCIYSFQFRPAFRLRRTASCQPAVPAQFFFLVYPISDIVRRRKSGEVSWTELTFQGSNDFELITTVKMETRHDVAVYFSSEFPAICNHCGVMAA